MTAHVVCFVPGIMGSELRLRGERIWPGPVASLIGRYTLMEQLLDDDIEATDVIRTYLVSRQYAALIDDLMTCGFRVDTDPATLILVPYDWRKSNGLAAEKLAESIDDIFDAHGGDCSILIVAHSMGGLVSRFYLESGSFSARPGFAAVSTLITMGTPHRGAPLALTAALGQEKRLFLSKEQVKQLGDDPRYPSLYELLPPEEEPFTWDERPAAALKHVTMDAGLAQKLSLSKANFTAARSFQAQLSVARRPAGVRYFFFVGSRQRTSCAVLLTEDKTSTRARPLEEDESGDGTVPIWSAGITGVQTRPVGGEHGEIYKNRELRKTLAELLGKKGVLATATVTLEVAVRDTVVRPDDPLHFVLTPEREVEALAGELRIEKANADMDGSFTPLGSPRAILYEGVVAERLALVTTAPEYPGVYRLVFATNNGVVGCDEFFVQDDGA